MAHSSGSVLYYPSIDITNERWLRSAALSWECIRTIVPESHDNPYSSRLARELSDEGVLVPIRVSSDMDEIEDLADTVLEVLTDPASKDFISSSPEPSDDEERPGKIRDLVKVHPLKFPFVVRSHLESALNGEWFQVAPGFANFYMTLLATKLAERLGLGLVTGSDISEQLAIAVHKGNPFARERLDHQRMKTFGSHFEAHGPRHYLPSDVAVGLLMNLAMKGIDLPKKVSARELIKFRNDHKEELAVFRKEMGRLVTEIPKDAPLEAMRQSVHDQYESNVLPAVRSLRKSLEAQSWEGTLGGVLKAAFFTAAPASAAVFAGVPSTLALLAGAGVTLTASVVSTVNQRRKIRNDSPYSYLLSLERTLG